ncbi:HD domain-containing phosphohydrolase [Sulfurimonas marina]|uniref:Transporter substrate-binding domain-containing protein n=1 Tax=Sulfurimonas marina TaxID=2590551 RepID=A0A7M1AW35_9BACT|nr:HD domain-containing phosphohydrolase [Sulfurimonas marina]QOP40572.1 transporter substrate-binding domain-containing protein [Sulfurimonas marina]
MFRRSIRTNILGIFLIIVAIVALSLLTSQYYFNNSMAIESTHKTFKLISTNISEEITSNNRDIEDILKTNTANTKLYKKITFDYNHPALDTCIQIMSLNKNIYATYFAHKEGTFYEVINMHESPLLFETYKAPKDTRWIVLIHINNKVEYYYLDATKKLLKQSSKIKKYNPLSRPWYKSAVNTNKPIMTEPYLFTNLKNTGTTYAVELKKKGSVLAIDMTMKKLNNFLHLQKFEKNSEIFLFNSNGNILASSNALEQNSKNNFQKSEPVNFTQEEQEYIKNSPPLIVSNEKDWVPFDFQSAGKPTGYSIDLLHLMAKKSGLKLEFINGLTWKQIIQNFKNKEIDIVQSIYKTPQREQFGLFSDPIYHFKNYFITNQHTTNVYSLKDLNYKRVGVVEGWAIEDLIKEKYPKIQLKRYDDLTSSILALSQDDIDAIIETKEAFQFLTKQLYVKNLTIGAWCAEYDNYEPRAIYLMSQKDDPILLSILNKTIQSITPQEKALLKYKWFTKNSNNNTMIDPPIMEHFLKGKQHVVEYSTNKKHYYAIYKPLQNGHLFLGIKLDSDVLLAPYYENMKFSFIIAIILLILSLPVIFYATRIIIEPIKDLIVENEKIKNRQFTKVNNINTNIIEFIELSNSMFSMSLSIDEYQRSQEHLLDSIVKLIADSIDAKSPYTGGHCKRVPVIAQMLVEKANESNEGIFKEFKLETEDELREFELGAWLHDCGKVTTPEYVVDKSTKLETIYNRIHEIRTRFEVLWRDAQIRYLEARLNDKDEQQALEQFKKEQAQLLKDFEFIASVNIGGEFMSQEQQQRVKDISEKEWIRHFDDSLGLGEEESLRYDKSKASTLPVTEKLLSDKQEHIVKRESFDYEAYRRSGFKLEVPQYLYNYGEVYNLCIEKGTLSEEERYKINEHVIMTIKMLQDIPFPKHLTNIPEYAGTHHETLIGTGYPKQLTKDELSIPARIMAIADIFEALTASDRPYKKAKTLSESLKILSFMVKDQHIDGDIFKLFLESDLHNIYAKKYLTPEQIDSVNIKDYL